MFGPIVLPEFIEAMTLFIASVWLFRLWVRTGYIGLLLTVSFLLVPCFGMFLAGIGAPATDIEFSKWLATSINFALTLILIRVTWREGAVPQAAQEIDRLKQQITILEAELWTRDSQTHRDSIEDLDPAGWPSNATRIREILGEVASG